MERCRLSDNDGCRNAFLQWPQSGGGPTQLYECPIDSRILADSLKGSSRLGILRLPSIQFLDNFHEPVANYPDMALILAALAENRGLTASNANGDSISHDNWSILCQSLQKHPTLPTLGLTKTGPMSPSGERRTYIIAGRAKDT